MMTGPPTRAALLVSACIALCKSQPEKSEATRDDEADPARPHRYRPVPDQDWQQHPSILAVKCNTARLGVITSQPVLAGLYHQAPSSLADWDPKRLRASGRDGETVMTEPPSPLILREIG